MADDLLTPTAQRRRIPVAASIAIVYLLARIVTTGMLLVAAELSGQVSRFGANATIGDLMVGWDAQWYWFVAVNGYPADLPLTESGLVAENQWAFMPLYAYLAAALGGLLGSWIAGAVAISVVSGYLACLVLYRITRMHADRTTAMWAVVFLAAAPLAALFQVGYAEALFLLWLFLGLWVVLQRRYAWLYLLVPLMGFTRPGVLAFALFLGLHGIHRWLTRRREPLPVRHIVHIVATGLLAVIVGFAWQVAAGLVTGDSEAYLSTELAWRRNWLLDPSPHFLPFDGFVAGSGFWFGIWGVGAATGYVVLALGVLAVAALLLFEPHVRRLGVDLRLWGASYLVYLLAVFFPQSSIFRLLIPLSPLWGAVAMPKSTAWRVGVLIACLIGQWWWIYNMYALGNTFWQIP